MVFLSKEGLTESSEKSKNSEINGCGECFFGLWGCAGGRR